MFVRPPQLFKNKFTDSCGTTLGGRIHQTTAGEGSFTENQFGNKFKDVPPEKKRCTHFHPEQRVVQTQKSPEKRNGYLGFVQSFTILEGLQEGELKQDNSTNR
jgi:hypothetical protein